MKGTRQLPKWQKVLSREGEFGLFQSPTSPMTWEVSFKISDGKYLRKRFKADSLESAVELAKEKSGVAPAKRIAHFTIVEAFKLTRADVIRNHKPQTTADWDYWAERFMKWLVEKHPECRTWRMMTDNLVEEYLSDHKGKSKLHPLNPIRQASRYMARKHDYRDFCAGIRVKSKLQKTPAEVYLEDVVCFCDFARDNYPKIEAGIALQGLAGLQLQEATRLTWDRVDLGNGLVEISGEVKNEYRNRVIPVCDRALEALKRAADTRPKAGVEPVAEHVLLSNEGDPFATNRWNYAKEVRKALQRWNRRIEWAPKDLRNCLPTFATIHGLQSDMWEMYIGHAPRSVTARHYVPRLNCVSRGEVTVLKRQMDLFRLHVTEPINRAIQGRFEVEILNFFERKAVLPLEKVQANPA